VNFSDHRFICPAENELESKQAIKRHVYDYTLAQALSRLADMQVQRDQLREQHNLLRRKLERLNAGQWGLESMFAAQEIEAPDQTTLEIEVEKLDADLEKLGGNTRSLDAELDAVADTLMSVETSISLHSVELNLDYRGVKINGSSAKSTNSVKLTEVHAQPNRRRIILMCRLPRTALPEKKSLLREAEHLLR